MFYKTHCGLAYHDLAVILAIVINKMVGSRMIPGHPFVEEASPTAN